jgi:hypothetical protein
LIVAQGDARNRTQGSIIPVRNRKEWTELIQDIATIGAGAVSELLWWYTFDPKVSETTVPIQPLLEILPDYLAVPMNLVTHSNIERNLQKLLNRHPNLRSFGEKVKSEGVHRISAPKQHICRHQFFCQANCSHRGRHGCGSGCL